MKLDQKGLISFVFLAYVMCVFVLYCMQVYAVYIGFDNGRNLKEVYLELRGKLTHHLLLLFLVVAIVIICIVGLRVIELVCGA